jgi:hypothetical protein
VTVVAPSSPGRLFLGLLGRPATALRDHLELATAIFSVELAGRSIFAF